MKNLICLTLLCTLLGNVHAQESKYGLSLNLNHNLYLPRNSENKTLYFIGFPNERPSFGSFGIGLSSYYQFNKNIVFKAGTHISCLSYIEPELQFRDKDNNPLSAINPVVKEYQNAWSVLAHYYIGDVVSVGAGLGANVRLGGRRKIHSEVLADYDNLHSKLSDRKRILPVVPIELSFAVERILLNVRLEYGLINRYKGDFAQFKKEKINMLYFEIGYFLKRHKVSKE